MDRGKIGRLASIIDDLFYDLGFNLHSFGSNLENGGETATAFGSFLKGEFKTIYEITVSKKGLNVKMQISKDKIVLDYQEYNYLKKGCSLRLYIEAIQHHIIRPNLEAYIGDSGKHHLN